MDMTPSTASRFWGFAAGHFVITALCLPLLFLAPGAMEQLPLPALALGMMALYVPAGWVVSALRRWGRPTLKQGLKAVLYPVLLAWGWAFGGWLLMLCGQFAPGPAGLGLHLLLAACFLACPSFTFMLAALDGGMDLTVWSGFGPAWYACMVLAGLLPPLLFFLGSLLPKKRLTKPENVVE